jgi:ATP-dependent DNA helicase RecG
VSRPDLDTLLHKVLLLEQRQNFQNRAMVGGLSAFGQELHSQAPPNSPLPEIALVLANYDDAGAVDRGNAVREALRLLSNSAPADARVARPTVDAPVVGQSQSLDPTPSAQRSAIDSLREPDAVAPPVPTRARATRARRAAQRGSKPEFGLDSPVTAFPRIGAKVAQTLAAVGIGTLRDLLYYFPRDHLDYRRQDQIRWLRYGDQATIIGVIQSVRTRRIRAKLSITTAIVADDSGRIPVNWFNQPYLEKEMRIGRRIAISGEVDAFDDRPTFTPRDFEWIEDQELTHAARLVPIYPLRKGLYQKSLRSLIRQASAALAGQIDDYLPEYVREHAVLLEQQAAVAQYHFPDDDDALRESRRRLAFDEIFSIRIGLLLRKREWEQEGTAPALEIVPAERQRFLDQLPFTLTSAQLRVAADVAGSIAGERPMSRLLQGDVGSGKTVVAALALYTAGLRRYQSAIMTPTEILAGQHFQSLSKLLTPLGLRVELLTGSTKSKERRALLAGVAAGTIDVLVGTHALFQEGVEFLRLGVAVVDEQHRFGVQQRTRLRQKGLSPHLLAMTATPIPRTLALTVYGDLDISVLDEMPPGRIPIQTSLVATAARAYTTAAREIEAGRQAFVVCPLIEESAETDTKSAMAEHRRLQSDVFPNLRIGLLHGRLPAKEKDRVLGAFRNREYDILVATSVVEVGIDIPNATVMVIREAHRFGLAQLHQLRGRVGRGRQASFCLLVSPATDGPMFERLQAVVASQDGFKLAEEDLRLRGPGEFWGTRQSGIPVLKVAGPGDVEVMEVARSAADLVVARDADLSQPDHAGIREQVARFWSTEAELH